MIDMWVSTETDQHSCRHLIDLSTTGSTPFAGDGVSSVQNEMSNKRHGFIQNNQQSSTCMSAHTLANKLAGGGAASH